MSSYISKTHGIANGREEEGEFGVCKEHTLTQLEETSEKRLEDIGRTPTLALLPFILKYVFGGGLLGARGQGCVDGHHCRHSLPFLRYHRVPLGLLLQGSTHARLRLGDLPTIEIYLQLFVPTTIPLRRYPSAVPVQRTRIGNNSNFELCPSNFTHQVGDGVILCEAGVDGTIVGGMPWSRVTAQQPSAYFAQFHPIVRFLTIEPESE